MSFDSSGAARTDTAKAGKGKKKTKTESQKLVGENSARIALIVANPGTKDVYLALGSTAVSGEGIYLKKEGGGNQPVVIQGYTGEVSCISAESEPELAYAEI